jgi:hypothetical protein
MDVWSFGCIAAEFCFRRVLFEAPSDGELQVLGALVARLGRPPEDIIKRLGSERWGDLQPPWTGMRLLQDLPCMSGMELLGKVARSCLQWDPCARPAAGSCLQQLSEQTKASVAIAVETEPNALSRGAQCCQSNSHLPSETTPTPTGPAESEASSQPPGLGKCQCKGYCQAGHKYRQPCVQTPPAGRELCHQCVCIMGCDKPKVWGKYCYHHSFQGLPLELQMVRLLGHNGVLDIIMPADIAVMAELEVEPMISNHWLLELLASWMKEPSAVRVFASLLKERPGPVTGAFIVHVLHQLRDSHVNFAFSSYGCGISIACF